LRGRGVCDLANLAALLVVSMRVPIDGGVKAQQAHRKDERNAQQP